MSTVYIDAISDNAPVEAWAYRMVGPGMTPVDPNGPYAMTDLGDWRYSVALPDSWNGIYRIVCKNASGKVVAQGYFTFRTYESEVAFARDNFYDYMGGINGLPQPSNVRQGVVYGDGLVGTAVIPATQDVRFGVAVDNGLLGEIVLPGVSDVREGVPFDINSIGTLVVEGSTDLPAVSDVRAGVAYDGGAHVGTLVLPAEADVRENIGYGAQGIEFVGQLLAQSGGTGGVLPPVVNGVIRSPLTIGQAYVAALGNAFRWNISLPFDPAGGTLQFKGRKKSACSGSTCPTSYDWLVTGNPTDLGNGLYELVFDMPSANTPTVPGDYEWWVSYSDGTNSVGIANGDVSWVCG